jgi:hypothetical protein
MGRTACTEPQCLYSRAIPLLPLWAVRLVQSLSAPKELQSSSFSTCVPDVHLLYVTIPDAVLMQFDLLRKSKILLETCACRGL